MRVVKNSEELPTTSVAEFRQAAWAVFNHNRASSVGLGIYLTWVALGGAIAVLAFGLAGLAVTQESWWAVAVGAVLLALVVWRIVRVFRRAAEKRAEVVARSRDIDARAARGELPMTPPGWPGDMPPALGEHA